MHTEMWEHPATVENVATLRRRGVLVLDPAVGRLTGADTGKGRLPEPAEIFEVCRRVLARGVREPDLAGRHVVVSAGGTREPLDPVRFLGNRSSGRMGFAIAEAAAARGAAVTVVAANVALETPAGVSRVDVETAAELQSAMTVAAGDADLIVMAAAVADFRPAHVEQGKAKKQPGEQTRTVELERTPDILAGLAAARRPGQTLVGFAAEHGPQALDYGRDKLARKGVDAVVVNDVSDTAIGFDSSDNEVVIVTHAGETPVPRGAKRDVADAILDVVSGLPPVDERSTARSG